MHLKKLIKNKQLTIIWISGHYDIDSNEVVNRHAKIAISYPNITLLKQILFCDIKFSIKDNSIQKW